MLQSLCLTLPRHLRVTNKNFKNCIGFFCLPPFLLPKVFVSFPFSIPSVCIWQQMSSNTFFESMKTVSDVTYETAVVLYCCRSGIPDTKQIILDCADESHSFSSAVGLFLRCIWLEILVFPPLLLMDAVKHMQTSQSWSNATHWGEHHILCAIQYIFFHVSPFWWKWWHMPELHFFWLPLFPSSAGQRCLLGAHAKGYMAARLRL